MRFILDEEPVAKMRPRFSLRGRKVITYDPQHETKTWVKWELEQQLKRAFASSDKAVAMEASSLSQCSAYAVRFTFHLPVPSSWSESERNAALWGLDLCTAKPDLDNLEKFYLDCCNGVLFEDDKQVFLLSSTKKYANKPKIVIDIMAKTPLSLNEKAKGILQIFGPEKLIGFIDDVKELFELYDVDEDVDWLLDKVGQENVREVRLARTAYVLSLVASRNAKAFDKIQRKYPDFWKDADRIAKEVEEFKAMTNH